jgi:phosphate transport system protein
MAERAIRRAMESLSRNDLALARDVVEGDYAINRRRYEIEEKAVALIATQQPMASDLRTPIAIFHIVTELERIGDRSTNIAERAVYLVTGKLEETNVSRY